MVSSLCNTNLRIPGESDRGSLDIKSTTIVVELSSHRQMVKDTDKGADLQSQIKDLEKLLYAYRNGLIKEKEEDGEIDLA